MSKLAVALLSLCACTSSGANQPSSDVAASSTDTTRVGATPSSPPPGRSSNARAAPPGLAAAASASTKVGSPSSEFTHPQPSSPQGLESCIYLGGVAVGCQDAFEHEKDPVVRKYILRLVESEASVFRERVKTEFGGTMEGSAPDAEVSQDCKVSGPCGGMRDTNKLDTGYACLVRAWYVLPDKAASKAAHARACKCDPEHARIPVGAGAGLLACDGAKPIEMGRMPLAEAQEARACAECDPKSGPAACKNEIDRLTKTAPDVAKYLETMHVPHCRKP